MHLDIYDLSRKRVYLKANSDWTGEKKNMGGGVGGVYQLKVHYKLIPQPQRYNEIH